ncbi:YchF/TatD family DNA exonuclease [Endozoicomonas sp. G2_1]|uniref:TatD family hydrolase n=1 Tax=Endozoicomonas sp. G2_1 TaxID=2821091 RepID=UPI001ADCDD9E|nr:TatD family hydrolase [Endozoicomonas sp. G2_1]MBO9489974.1 YchF/TatD family DNA exonuclease [Endozoicomonas sp. G2_1]
MIDIGVNLTSTRFAKDLDDVIARAKDVGVSKQLVTGTNIQESEAAIVLAQRYPDYLYTTAGIHPHNADDADDNFVDQITKLAQSSTVKAIGECGLDYNRNFSSPENQRRVFKAQISLAAELRLPLFLHQRDAFTDWYQLLEPYFGKVPAMVSHCFTGSEQELLQCLDAGMYIGITGWLCDKKRGQALRDIVAKIPLERLMIETDAPYLTPQNIRPKPKSSRNEPAYLPYVVDMIAECTDYSAEQIISHSNQNAARVFNLI